MEENLMNKEVVCMFDTRKMQKFMFRTSSVRGCIGASDLMLHILDDALLYALRHLDPPLSETEYDLSMDPEAEVPYFTSEKIQFQLLYSAAGNALCLVRTGALCQKVIRKVSRYYLENAYSLNLAAAAVAKTEDMGRDTFEIYKKLAAIKASCSVADPLTPLPIVLREEETGEPAVRLDITSGRYVSRSTIIQQEQALHREHCVDLDEIHTTEAGDHKAYRALIHADGNNLGITIGRILQCSRDYREGTRTRRIINRRINGSFDRVVRRTTEDMREICRCRGKNPDDFDREFMVMHRAGDDVNIACCADMVFPFLESFYRHLDGELLWDEPGLRIPLYVCAGIAFVTEEMGFHRSFSLAQECCKSAKTAAKKPENLRNGLAGNWVDFQICDDPGMQALELLREQSCVTKEGIRLLMRPYRMDGRAESAAGEEGRKREELSYASLLQRMRAYRTLSLDDNQKRLMRISYTCGRAFFERWVQSFPDNRLVQTLGNPLYTDAEGHRHAAWFDAAELSDFL